MGDDTSIWGEVLGGYGEEVCNENGKRLLQFSSTTFKFLTDDSHTKESTSTLGNVEPEGSGLLLTTWWERRL